MVRTYGCKTITQKNKGSDKLASINFFLCKFCFDRNFKSTRKTLIKYRTIIKICKSKFFECYICKSLFDTKVNKIYNEIINSKNIAITERIKKINIGTHLPYTIYEREDFIRSLFEIKGNPNIKNHFNNLIRKMFTNEGFFIDYIDPDIKIDISMNDNLTYQIDYRTREIILVGHYNKFSRGTSQRKIQNNRLEKNISIKEQNNPDKIAENKSIEQSIHSYIANQFGTYDYKISWTGSEDKDSMVLGKGRPFIVRINNPKTIKDQLPIKFIDHVKIHFQEINTGDIDLYSKYRIKVILWIKILEHDIKIPNDVLGNVTSSLIGNVKFNNKNKVVEKKIYSSSYRMIDPNNFQILMIVDNGIPIKQLVGCNEYIEPCISKMIGTKCECIYFDIENILIDKCRI
ncbi:MAG: hypothetical protein M3162_01545 [Thermoproteota archaeon]|nr:hypothetical protein [Thermoproteota archaeon]